MKLSRVIFITLVTCLILGLSAFFYLALQSRHHDEGTNVFTSKVYERYHQQLYTFLENHPQYREVTNAPPTPFNSVMQSLLANGQVAAEKRQIHENFVYFLRKLALLRLNSQPALEEKASFQLLDDLVRWLFLQADLSFPIQEYLDQHLTFSSLDDIKKLPHMFATLLATPVFNGMQYPPKEGDGFLHGNLPSRYFALPNHPTQVIRLALPVSESRWNFLPGIAPKPHPEFLLFLHLQPSHLYVNVMKRKGVEAKCTKILEELEENYPNLYVITLDKNSPFYWQDPKRYPEKMSAKEFQQLFIETMLSKTGPYFWSSHLQKDLWEKELHELISQVHRLHFEAHKELSRADRRDWIELTYLAILDHLAAKWQPSSMNITCKGSMDRGPSLAVLWLWDKQIADLRKVTAWILAPPLLFHNRAPHRSRIERFASAAVRLDKKK